VKTRRFRSLLVVGCLSVLLCGLLGVRGSSAAFTAALTVDPSTFVVDRLANYFAVAPGTDAIASGDVDTLGLDLGFVASARTFTNLFTVTNVTAVPQSAALALAGIPVAAAATFNTSGSATVTLAPGASTAVSVQSSATTAGRGAGTLELRLAGSTWLYRTYAIALDVAPQAPATLTATAKPAGRIQLTWPASTTTNLSGYDVYRASGAGSLAKVATVTGTTYDDTATVDATSYRYVVRSTSSSTPSFASVDSPQATATADATAPAAPTLTAGAYANAATASAFPVTVTLAAASLSSDTLGVAITNGTTTVSGSPAASQGAGSVAVSLNASSLPEGALTIRVTSTDLAGNVSAAATRAVTKDTVAPGPPTATYSDKWNAADQIAGTAEGNAAIRATRTAPSAAGPYTATAAAGGAYTVTVAVASRITVTYSVTATDAAGNVSAARSVTFATTQ
jgi:hypothetical protein